MRKLARTYFQHSKGPTSGSKSLLFHCKIFTPGFHLGVAASQTNEMQILYLDLQTLDTPRRGIMFILYSTLFITWNHSYIMICKDYQLAWKQSDFNYIMSLLNSSHSVLSNLCFLQDSLNLITTRQKITQQSLFFSFLQEEFSCVQPPPPCS